ncbi:MAG: sigma-70 family RNA polymerase sigma factor [Bdellovibrionaceae bacterium]|nr:sigma-70 family RNA polymerase sigma factor [Pseudobdellovibrionaceae bacterium]
MRTKKPRPWLTPTGVEIPTAELKEICTSWDQATWESYLNWYQSPRRDALVCPAVYEKKTEDMTGSIFQQLDHNTDPGKRNQCEQLLQSIPVGEANVLRHVFFDGRTVREIAAIEKTAKSTVHDLKNRALLRLRRGQDGENPDTRRLMRGVDSDESNIQSFWAQPLSFSIREDKVYDPSQYKEEFAKISHSGLKMAMGELSDREQRILYLRFWCDYSVSEIARELRSGVNLIEQVIEAAISKLKRKVVHHEIGFAPGEGPSCA